MSEIHTPAPTITIDRSTRRLLAVGRGEDLTPGVATETIFLSRAAQGIATEALRSDIRESQGFNVLIVPTPARTEQSYNKYVDNATDIFQNIGGNVTILHGPQQTPSQEQYLDGLGNADVVWITGGSSVDAKRSFDETGFGQALIDLPSEKVISGGSAGAVLQATEAMSWYTPTDKPEENEFRPTDGLGIIDVTLSPHLDYIERNDGLTLPRSHYFGPFLMERMVTRPGLGIDDAAAIAFNGETFRVLRQDNANPEAGISIFRHNQDQGLTVVRHMPSSEYRPLSELGRAA